MQRDNDRLRADVAKLTKRVEVLLQAAMSDHHLMVTGESEASEPGLGINPGNLERWQLATEQLKERDLRAQHFPAIAGEDGCWYILLYIMRSQIVERRVSVTDAASASTKSATTGLRCLEALIRQGLIQRSLDRANKRPVWLILTDEAWSGLKSYCTAVGELQRDAKKQSIS